MQIFICFATEIEVCLSRGCWHAPDPPGVICGIQKARLGPGLTCVGQGPQDGSEQTSMEREPGDQKGWLSAGPASTPEWHSWTVSGMGLRL